MEGTSPGSVGLVVVGLGGLGSSLIAGIEATRAHLVHPWGSLAEGGGAGRPTGSGFVPARDEAPLAHLADLALGAFELREDDAHRAILRAHTLSRSLVDELRPQLRQIRAMLGARQAPTRRHLADALAEDLRGFLAHHRCARGVVVCTVPGPQGTSHKFPFSAGEVWSGLEDGAEWVTPGLVYAAAAAQAGFAFVAAAHDGSICAPGVSALFADAKLPIAGAGLLGPDAALREALAGLVLSEGLGLSGSASLSTRVEERGARLWGGPDRTEEMALASAWAGGSMEVSVQLRGPVALYLAGRALDAALFAELALRAGRSGAQEWMDALFAAPLGTTAPREAAAQTLAERRRKLRAEIAALAETARRQAA